MPVGMFDTFITRNWFDPEGVAIWDDTATLQAWLDVEAALAAAQAELGLVPPDCAAKIAEMAQATRFEKAELTQRIEAAQHPFVPVLAQFETLCGEPAAGYIHLGATTQNIFDTATSLQMRRTVERVLALIEEILAVLRPLADQHADTLQAGRTHGQHALPITFGFKLAGWIDDLMRHRSRLRDRFDDAFVASLGGAVGTGAALGEHAEEVERRMAAHLDLQPVGLAMRSSYDRVADYLSALCLFGGTVERIASDIVFMQRTEVGEVSEAFHVGKVGSSTMPQKHNPSTALKLVSVCRLLRGRLPVIAESMVRMDEGDSSAANVADVTVPEVAVLAVSVAATLRDLVGGLEIHPSAMARNLAISEGLIVSEAVMMALTPELGRHAAHHLLYEVAHSSQLTSEPFLEVLREHPAVRNMSQDRLDALLDPVHYSGRSAELARKMAKRA